MFTKDLTYTPCFYSHPTGLPPHWVPLLPLSLEILQSSSLCSLLTHSTLPASLTLFPSPSHLPPARVGFKYCSLLRQCWPMCFLYSTVQLTSFLLSSPLLFSLSLGLNTPCVFVCCSFCGLGREYSEHDCSFYHVQQEDLRLQFWIHFAFYYTQVSNI